MERNVLYLYIGAALAAVLLLVFITLSICWIADKVTESVNRRASDLLADYDNIIELKSVRLKKLETEISEKEILILNAYQAPARAASGAAQGGGGDLVRTAQRLAASDYRQSGLAEIYNCISSGFSNEPEEVLKDLINHREEAEKENEGQQQVISEEACSTILEKISYENFFQLSTLEEKDQLAILEAMLEPEEKALLNEFREKHKVFKSLDFYSDIKARALESTKIIKLSVRPGADVSPRLPSEVAVSADPGIIEGFCIYMGGKIYDYSLSRKEIS